MSGVLNLVCPGCGAPVESATDKCPYCDRRIVISTFSGLGDLKPANLKKYIASCDAVLKNNPNPDILYAQALALFQLKLYDKAINKLEQVIDLQPDKAEAHALLAVANLKGKKPFMLARNQINSILEYVDAAIAIHPDPLFFLLSSYIRYDYFYRKKYAIESSYLDILQEAKDLGLSDMHYSSLEELICRELPKEICL